MNCTGLLFHLACGSSVQTSQMIPDNQATLFTDIVFTDREVQISVKFVPFTVLGCVL